MGLIGHDRMKENWGLANVFLLGSILPDFDMAWWLWLSDRQVSHHTYWTHLPAFWLTLFAIALAFGACAGLKSMLRPLLVFGAAILAHLIMDTHVGGILWAYPFSDHKFCLFAVPNDNGHFLVSAILHWTFLIEVPLILIAAYVTLRRLFSIGFRRNSIGYNFQ